MNTYSQNGEDLIISEYFGSFKGYLLSIGENNGKTFSNARLLIENGWNALLIEPSLAYNNLVRLYSDHELVTCDNKAVSDKYGTSVWYELEDSLLSTMDKSIADTCGRKYETTAVDINPYSEIANNYDFITIDAEGSDWIILQQIDLTYTKCLCIEYSNDPVMCD